MTLEEAVEWSKRSTCATILCGGQGKRLGGINKGELMLFGERYIDRVIKVAMELSPSVSLAGKHAELFASSDLDILEDDQTFSGQLGGIASAFQWALENQKEWIWLFACDLPLLTVSSLSPLMEKAQHCENSCCGVVYHDEIDFKLHPLAGLWRTDGLERLKRAKTLGLTGLIKSEGVSVSTRSIPVEAHGINPLHNINCPEDLRLLSDLDPDAQLC